MAKRSRRSLTLIEIMVVLFIIGLALSVLIPWMKGSLDEGKAFKTKQRAQQISQMLTMAAAQSNVSLDAAASSPETYLTASGLVQNSTKFLLDGWGQPMKAEVVHGNDGDFIRVLSDSYRKHMQRKHGPGWTESAEE